MRLFSLEHAPTTDDWYTPAWVFEGMGETFDLDVCTPPGGVPWIPCHGYFTEDDDGLAQEWTGFVWCNPPYSRPRPWCEKWAEHVNGVLAIRSDFSTVAHLVAIQAATSMFFPSKRVSFLNGHGGRSESPNFSTVLLAAGPRADQALARLEDVGRGIHRGLL